MKRLDVGLQGQGPYRESEGSWVSKGTMGVSLGTHESSDTMDTSHFFGQTTGTVPSGSHKLQRVQTPSKGHEGASRDGTSLPKDRRRNNVSLVIFRVFGSHWSVGGSRGRGSGLGGRRVTHTRNLSRPSHSHRPWSLSRGSRPPLNVSLSFTRCRSRTPGLCFTGDRS